MPSLRTVRRNQLLSQRDLAKKAQVTPSTIYLIEAGQTRPRLKIMRKICEALALAPQEITEFRIELGLEPVAATSDIPTEQRLAG